MKNSDATGDENFITMTFPFKFIFFNKIFPVVAGCTGICHIDNFQCNQRWNVVNRTTFSFQSVSFHIGVASIYKETFLTV